MINIRVQSPEKIHISIRNADSVEISTPNTQTLVKNIYPHYTGRYTATPDVEPIVLPTRDKVMDNDVTIFKIPLWEVSNQSGTTIYIGGEEVYGN